MQFCLGFGCGFAEGLSALMVELEVFKSDTIDMLVYWGCSACILVINIGAG